jgi:glycosyltransferase involved in cell wall biosynthesis
MKDLAINIISLRMQHHSNASGYDKLINYLDADVINTNRNLTIFQRAITRACRSKIKGSNSLWYQRANFIAELNAAMKWVSKKKQIFHFLYGENSYRYFGSIKSFRKENRIVCTYHTPPERFKEIITYTNFLTSIDALIVVSSVQYDFFAEILGPERVHFIPHGVDTEYYQPPKHKVDKNSFNCISVGTHLRDFPTLANVAKILKTKDIRFIIVAPEKFRSYFDGLTNVEVHSSINDESLLNLYQSADVLLLPLLDCTANNALLEGMSCGLSVVTTDLPGVKDYVIDDCSILAPKGDHKALADAICLLYENEEQQIKLCKSSRTHALEFKWPNIANKIQNVYAQITNH